MEPTKGQIVNYHCLPGERYLCNDEDLILPGIITHVYKGSQMKAVDLTVFTNNPSMPVTMRTSIAMGMTNGGGWTARTANKDKDINKEAQSAKVG